MTERSSPGSEPRFFIDHGMVHDRVTGKHVTTDGQPPFEDSIEQVCEFLNSLSCAPAKATFDLLSRAELVSYFRTEECADEIADIIGNFPPSVCAPAQAAQDQKLRDALREAERVRDEWCAEYVALRDTQPQAALSYATSEVPFAWRYEAASLRIWKDGKPVGWDGWEWKTSDREPNMGEAMRNVTPLYPRSSVTPAQPQAVETTDVSVPAAALDWLFGAAPDADGKWFGECEEEAADRTRRIFPPKYWWRSKFRSMIPALSRPQCQTCGGRREVGGFVSAESGYQTDPCPDCSAHPSQEGK